MLYPFGAQPQRLPDVGDIPPGKAVLLSQQVSQRGSQRPIWRYLRLPEGSIAFQVANRWSDRQLAALGQSFKEHQILLLRGLFAQVATHGPLRLHHEIGGAALDLKEQQAGALL